MIEEQLIGAIGILSPSIIERIDGIPPKKKLPEHPRLVEVAASGSKFRIVAARQATGNGVGKFFFDIVVLDGRARGHKLPVCKDFVIITEWPRREEVRQRAEAIPG